MPLSTLGNINQLGQAMIETAGAPTPLDALEARRASREAERVKAIEAEAKQMKAKEDAAAGTATRATEAATALVLRSAPKITAEPGSKEFVQQVKAVYQYAVNSGDDGAIERTTSFLSNLGNLQKTAEIDETAGGIAVSAEAASDNASARQSEATAKLTESLVHKDISGPSDAIQEWAKGYVSENDPGKQPFLNFKSNKSRETVDVEGAELARIYDDVIRSYAHLNPALRISPEEAKKEAIRRWHVQQGATPANSQPNAAPTAPPGNPGARRRVILN